MAWFIPFIPAAVAVVGAIAGANASKRQAEAEGAAADYNAALATRDAEVARTQGEADVFQLRQAAYRKIGSARAAYGASGVTVEGSPLDVLELSASNAELDVQNTQYATTLKAMGYGETAQLERMRGTNARATGNEQAAASILTGGARIADRMPRVSSTSSRPGTAIPLGQADFSEGYY